MPKFLLPIMLSLLVLLLAQVSFCEETEVNIDGTSYSTTQKAVPNTPAAGTVSHSCADGTVFDCKPTSAHCFKDSPVYCKFSVDLVKDIMNGHDKEIEGLAQRLEELEKQHTSAKAAGAKLREKIQVELKQSSKRVFLMEPKFFKGHFMATDNAIFLVAIFASIGVAAGVLGGSLIFKK
mmetsp:Transcript_12978/g.15502  ORF Transcript_12978/g.15502 Transcript_12978/m.15502 type:complete len:179 (-) Transcript_12978:127-663(-)|eukprot:CAMPEP_0114359650 /NCGR_PEP_ID=MMETSP0101-20121206/23185_1 /TAXON_ID=38822 ORGANISM="Pteridomonas danica, Strain PT" /NCGR_SAMPLE_ID=MMETSP0101 /ASSEMBLY_ACC=CAM_ASM_000211 /LENGTH=178 /DNA_ID=CAMNT_0001503317 /DNA_START=17 /DNA_END=553 /DNA_ORIENTATION=+